MKTPAGPDAEATAASTAGALGVVDALVFRRIGRTAWAHLGGLGRGAGWAGIIEIDEAADPLAVHIPDRVGEIYRDRFDEPTRVMGPYYATAGAVIRVSRDVAVVLGNPDGPLTGDDAELLRLAHLLDRAVGEAHPTKRLADELEVLHTVRDIMDAPVDRGLPATLKHLVTVVNSALSCNVGVLRCHHGVLTVVGDAAERADDWDAVLDEIEARMQGGTWCTQDMTTAPSQRIKNLVPSVRSMMAMSVPPPIDGLLLVMHTAVEPRGFTSQCRRLCRHVIDTGVVMARTAILRDELRNAADTAASAARTDSLTGLGNRLAWDEAFAQAQEEIDAGKVVTVMTVDVDGLKTINDTLGHDAGDQTLRRCAEIIGKYCSDADLAVRMGGDEFAVLVPHHVSAGDDMFVSFVAELSGTGDDPHRVSASVGMSTAWPGGSLADALREADLHMYRHKRDRR